MTFRPQRGDEVERWLKAFRDDHSGDTPTWQTADWLLDTYREHADTGTPLDSEVVHHDSDLIRGIERVTGETFEASTGQWMRPLGPDDSPHCRSHIVFRSDCAECRSEREFS